MYHTYLSSIALSPITFSSKRNANYLAELLFLKGLLNKPKAEAILENIRNIQNPNQKAHKNYTDFVLDAMVANKTLPEKFNFEPYRANKLSLLLLYPT